MTDFLNPLSTEGVLATAATPELLNNKQFTGFKFSQPDDADRDPAEFHTFRFDVSDIQIITDLETFVSPVSGKVGSPGTGELDDRIFIPSNTLLVFSWHGRDLFFVNAQGGETPAVKVTGFAIRVDAPSDI